MEGGRAARRHLNPYPPPFRRREPRNYNAKHKKHGLLFVALTDETGNLIWISPNPVVVTTKGLGRRRGPAAAGRRRTATPARETATSATPEFRHGFSGAIDTTAPLGESYSNRLLGWRPGRVARTWLADPARLFAVLDHARETHVNGRCPPNRGPRNAKPGRGPRFPGS